ncbi:MAG TPA: metallopeptidase TldD-related protein, partial [Verrucomicrobiae bacterium]|nr:metallopeptidase TldD-related protein [Verrucomicrobiae bacterium]
GSGLWLETDYSGTLADLIASTDTGILVHSVLGLHTQDSTSGSYSLSAPHCLKIENGKITGRVKAVLNGNFFTHLNDETTTYGISAGEKLPAMKFTAQVVKD